MQDRPSESLKGSIMVEYTDFSSWYDGIYRDKSPVIGAARSFRITGKKKEATLLVHGYAGYPGEFFSLAAFLAPFSDIYCPRLPGMGTSGDDFVHTSEKDWLCLVSSAIEDLRNRYEKLYIVAHSMGASLSLSEKADKIVLAAPAFRLKSNVPALFLKGLEKEKKILSLPWKSDSSYRMHYPGAPDDDEMLGKEYWSHLYPSQFLSLKRLMKSARKKIETLSTPVLLILAKEDQIVRNITHFSNPNVSIAFVDDGTHYLFYDRSEDAEKKAIALTKDFLFPSSY